MYCFEQCSFENWALLWEGVILVSAKTKTVSPSHLAMPHLQTCNSTAALAPFPPSSFSPSSARGCSILHRALGWKGSAGFPSCLCCCFVLELLCISEVSVSTWTFCLSLLFIVYSKATVALCDLWHYLSTVLAEICLLVTVVQINISLGSHGVYILSLQVPVLRSRDDFVVYKTLRLLQMISV